MVLAGSDIRDTHFERSQGRLWWNSGSRGDLYCAYRKKLWLGQVFGAAHLGVFLGRILLDTVVYVGAMERFNHSRTPVLGRFVESCGRGQRLEKSSLELCGGCNKIPSPGVPVTVHFGGLNGGSLYVLSHTHLRDPHPWPGFIQQAL